MDMPRKLAFCIAVATLPVASAVFACGDKLSVIGGGVSFDRVSQHRGNVVMLVEPNSSLRAANEALKLRQALEYAGNKVRTVDTAAELESVLQQGQVDVVLVSWGESGKLQAQLAERAGSPTVLPVAYKTDPVELTSARSEGTCFAQVEQRADKRLVRAVGRVMEQREKKAPLDCRNPVVTTST
jgi:DNA-binding NtrC family response regulator